MAKRYISDLEPGANVEGQVFLVDSKDLRTATNGSLYIHAVLADRTGRINARMWQASEALYNALPQGGYVELKGRSESYKGNPQFIIDAIRPVSAENVDPCDFMATTTKNVDEMWERIVHILRTVRSNPIQLLLKEFVTDQEFVARFKRSPAAAVMHHAYIGGLCEHTLNVLEVAQLVIPRYPEVSLDLVLAGLFLHDVGKTAELTCETGFAYSDPGQLLGHIALAAMWVEEKCRKIAEQTGKPFPEKIKWALQHIILAHHGQYEFGSPKLPATPEAIAIHHIDNLDAKLNQYVNLIDADKDPKSNWTRYEPSLGTKIYKLDVISESRVEGPPRRDPSGPG